GEEDNLAHAGEDLTQRLIAREAGQVHVLHKRLAIFLGEFGQLHFQLRGGLNRRWRDFQQLRGQRFADAIIADVDEHQLRLECQKLKAADQLFLLRFQMRGGRAFPFFEAASDALQEVDLDLIQLLLFDRARFLQKVLDLVDAVRDDFQVGEDQLLAKSPQLIDEAAAAMPREDDHEAVDVAHDGEPARIVAALRRVEARRIKHLHARRRCLLGIEQPGKKFQTRIGDQRLADLTLLRARGVWRVARQPMENGALAAARKSRDADFHGGSFKVPSYQPEAQARNVERPRLRFGLVCVWIVLILSLSILYGRGNHHVR